MIARTAALAARPAVDLLDSIADEIDGEMRQALYVTPDEADAGALVDAGLSAVCAADVAMIDRAAHDATLADQAVVVVAPRDGSTVAYLVREVPGVDVRELSLPATYGSVVAMLGHRPSVLGRSWTEDEAAAKREAWIAWASTQARSVGDADDDVPHEPFPVAALPPSLHAMATEGAAAQGVDVAYWAVPMLGILAGCVGATRRVRLSGDWSEPAVLWTAVVAPSGAGKSPPLRALLRPVREHDYALHLRTVAAQQQHAADVAAWKSNGSEGEMPSPPPMLASLVDDATMEALSVRLADNPRGLLLAVDELAGWLRSQNKYRSGGDEQAWLSIHAADALKVDRKGGGGAVARVYVRRAAVSVAGTIQPAVARRYLGDAESRERGTTARLLLAAPPVVPAKWTDREIPDHVRDGYGRVARSLLDLGLTEEGDPEALRPEADALAMFVDYHDTNGQACADAARAGDDDLAAALSKLRGAAPRIALLLALARAAEDGTAELLRAIGAESMAAGITIARWFEAEARRIYSRWADDDAADRAAKQTGSTEALAERLKELLATGPQTLRELHAATGRNLPATAIRAALATLEVAGQAKRLDPDRSRPGRPAERWGVCS